MGRAGALPPVLGDAADAVARVLAQAGCDAARGGWVSLAGGANNTVLLYRDADRQVVLKRYHRDPADSRDRLDTEVKFLRYAAEAAPGYTPELLAVDVPAGIALLSYIAGAALDESNIAAGTIRRAGAFLAALNTPAHHPAAAHLPVASEAAFSVSAHIDLIEERLSSLDRDAEPTPATAAQARAVLENLRRRWDGVRATLEKALAAGDVTDEVGSTDRIVSPSDFGFHNARFDATGTLRFFDFEYAGWDDPAKTLSDFFLQPRIPVALSWQRMFLDAGPPLHAGILRRTEMLMPLFAVKWACIVLKSLIPAHRARRLQIYPGASVDALLEAQIALAQDMLQRLDATGRT